MISQRQNSVRLFAIKTSQFLLAQKHTQRILFLSFTLTIVFSVSLQAQSFQTFTLPPAPLDSIQKLQADRSIFAYPLYTALNVKQLASTWIANDSVHHALIIASPEALSINIIFNDFFLPQGSSITFSSANKQQIEVISRSPFSSPSTFASPLIDDDTIIIHIQEPIANNNFSRFEIEQISQGFKHIGTNASRLRAADCHININCDEAADWKMQKKSVCRLLIGNRYCTGTLVNNTANDTTPYVLTANHCVRSTTEAAKTIFYFNYEHFNCESTSTLTRNQYISGAELIATGKGNQLDFTLLKMSATPPASFQVYYSGWDAKHEQSLGESCIHHPGGGAKRLALSQSALKTGTFSELNSDGSKFIPKSHWLVSKWSRGTTAGGSSGSALLNENKQIIGVLTGGESNCAAPNNDYFTKFSFAWDYNSEAEYQLKKWLDPINSGANSCNGFFQEFALDSIPVFSAQSQMYIVSSGDVNNWSAVNELNMNCFANTIKNSNQFVIGITAGINSVGNELGTTAFCVWDNNFNLLHKREVANSQLRPQSANQIYFSQPIAVPENFNIGVCYNQSESSSLFLIQDNNPAVDASFCINQKWTSYNNMNFEYNLALQPLITYAPQFSKPISLPISYYSLPRQQFVNIPNSSACKIYPQPASDYCKVQFLYTWYASIDCIIIDLNGTIVWRGSVNNNDGVHNVPLHNISSGIYSLLITAGGITEYHKIVKGE